MRDIGKCFWKTWVCDEMGAQDNTTLQSEYILKNYYYVSTANIVVTKAVSWFHRSLQNILQEQFLFSKCPRSPRTCHADGGGKSFSRICRVFRTPISTLRKCSFFQKLGCCWRPHSRSLRKTCRQQRRRDKKRLWTTSKDSKLEDLYNFYNRNSEKFWFKEEPKSSNILLAATSIASVLD